MRTFTALSSLFMVTATALLVGCAGTEHYLYRPTEHATATLPESGLPAALYQIPPGLAQGEVKIASLGIHEVQEPAGRHLVVRLVVNNNSDATWSLDTSRQQVTYPSGESVAPARAYATVPLSSTWMEVPSRQQRTVDLLFPVPAHTKVAYFRIAWSVNTPSAYVTQYSSFRREDADAYADGVYASPGRYYLYAGLWGLYGPPYLYWNRWSSPWWGYGGYGYPRGGGWGGGGWGGGGYTGPRNIPAPPARGLSTPPIYRGGFSGGGRSVGAPPPRGR